MKNIIFFLFLSLFVNISIYSQHEYIDFNDGNTLNLNGFRLLPNVPNIFAVDQNGNIPGWLGSYPWGCTTESEDAIYLNRNRHGAGNSPLNLTAMEEVAICGVGNIGRNFTTSMCWSSATYKYGLFELTCRTPRSKLTTSAFWLFGGGNYKSEYNEIDVFEGGSGDWIGQCNHSNLGNGRVSEHKTVSSIPGLEFGGSEITYQVLWEPNKIVWYINGIRVRTKIECENNPNSITRVPSVPMHVIINNGITITHNFHGYLPDELDDLDILNFNIWQRIPIPPLGFNEDIPIVNYEINGQQSILCSDPIRIAYTEYTPIMIDLNLSYLPKHKLEYTLYKVIDPLICNDENNLEFITVGQIDFCSNYDKDYSFDLNSSLMNNGDDPLEEGTTYKLLIKGLDIRYYPNTFTEVNSSFNIFRTETCVDEINFRVNGEPVCTQIIPTCPEIIDIFDNHGKSRVILNLEDVSTCFNRIFVSLELSDINYTRQGGEIFKWLSPEELEFRHSFDLEKFANDNNLNLCPGNYYRLKVATTSINNTWHEKLQLLHFEDCNLDINPAINDVFQGPVQIDLGEDIILSLNESEFCSRNYSVTIVDQDNQNIIAQQEFNFYINGGGFTHDDDSYTVGRINLRNLGGHLINLACDHDYLVRIETLPNSCMDSIVNNEIIFHTNACTVSNSEFMTRTDICWGQINIFNYMIRDDFDLPYPPSQPNFYLYAPNFISCYQRCLISLEELGAISGPNLLYTFELNPTEYYDLIHRGDLNYKKLVADRTLAYFEPGRRYRLTLTAIGRNQNANDLCANSNSSHIDITTFTCSNTGGIPACCTIQLTNPHLTDRYTTTNLEDYPYTIFPNPVSKLLNISTANTNVKFQLYNLNGMEVKAFNLIKTNEGYQINLESISPGIYLLKANNNLSVFMTKIVKS